MISYHKIQQDADCIARTTRSVQICRYFLRSVVTLLPPVLESIARVEKLYTL